MSDVVLTAQRVATFGYVSDEQGPAYPLYQRVLREKSLRGWTWTRLQQETGIGRSTFNSWRTQPQPPQPRTVNEIADLLNIPRETALRLAGILTGSDGDLVAECEVERQILATSIDPEFKREIVLQHRENGHTARCGPFDPAQADLGALSAPAAS